MKTRSNMHAQGRLPAVMKLEGAVRAALVGLGGLLVLPVAQAQTEDVPLYLQLAQYLQHDNNLFRDNRLKVSDTISTTQVRVGVDKQYGRQAYNLDATIGKNKYKNYSEYDNDSHKASGYIVSDILADFRLTLKGSSSRELPGFDTNNTETNRLQRNVSRQTAASIDLRYGLHGRFAVNTGMTRAKSRYDVTTYSNRDTLAKSVGLSYSPSEPLRFGVNYTKSDIDLPKLPVYTGVLGELPVTGEKVDRDSVQFTSTWTVTGYSALYASIGATRERYEIDERRDFDGLTGALNWRYSPTDKTSYVLSVSRDTSNEGGQQGIDLRPYGGRNTSGMSYLVKNRTITRLNGKVNWQASPKISANGGYTYARYDEAKDGIFAEESIDFITDKRGGVYHAIEFGVDFTPVRYIETGCSVSFFDRTASALTAQYDGRTLSCYAGFTLQ